MRMKSLTCRYGKNLPSNQQGLDGKIFSYAKLLYILLIITSFLNLTTLRWDMTTHNNCYLVVVSLALRWGFHPQNIDLLLDKEPQHPHYIPLCSALC